MNVSLISRNENLEDFLVEIFFQNKDTSLDPSKEKMLEKQIQQKLTQQNVTKFFFQKNYPFWEHLTVKEKQIFYDQTVIKTFQNGTYIDRIKECFGLISVKSGKIRIVLQSEEGRDITLFRLGTGDICVFTVYSVLDIITYNIMLEAEDNLELYIINSQIVNTLVHQNIYLKSFCYQLAAQRLSNAMWTLQQILFIRADKRLANLLYNLMKTIDTLEIQITHEQIAKDIGSTREVVTRLLKYFVNEDILELSRGIIRIIDKEKLIAITES